MIGHRNLTSTVSLTLSIIFLFVYNIEDVFAVPTTHLCRPEQRNALLEFKKEFEVLNSSIDYTRVINGSTVNPHQKTESWTYNSDCCNWEGITCNVKSGEVIELNLSCSYLRGRFDSSSSFQNLLSLTTLDLSSNQISGQIPSWIENLSHLTKLNLSHNKFSGYIPPTIGKLSQLTSLSLSSNNFIGHIPSSFGSLNQLTILDVSSIMLSGKFPITLLNLTKLSYLSLNGNQLTGTLPPNITSLSKLKIFDAAYNAFTGTIPSSLFTIPSLQFVHLEHNQLNGTLDFGNVSSPSKLQELKLNDNNLRGPIPSSISKFTNLEYLDLSHLNTQGPVNFSLFSYLKSLNFLHLSHLNTTTTVDLNDIISYFKRPFSLDLSGNHVSAANKSSVSYPPSQWIQELYLSGCSITDFPELLRTQQLITDLDISNNKLKGQVPGWLWTLPNLEFVNLSNNTFVNFERSTKPALSVMMLFISNNNFTGKIPSFICDFRSLRILDLSDNNFNGLVPRCLGKFKSTLEDLNLRQNRLHGTLPENIFESLRMLDVSHNQLTGKLPRSLIHFSSLEVLRVESNIINDTFPFWLSSLPELKILVLCSNAFHGPIHQASFPKLQIIDIAHNHFSGALPPDYFVKWSAMSSLGEDEDQSKELYMGDSYYHDSMVLRNKGVEMDLRRILKVYRAIDFSVNKFEGEIPRSIGLLKELHMLNLSNNAFTGHIPSSLGNLKALESLDVSQNRLSGEIPQELGSLSFLAVMNFSHNQLAGLVPGGTQFGRQNCSSFEDNIGLFGPSLDVDCPTAHQQYETLESEEEDEEVMSWIATVIGGITGFAFGVTIRYILVSYKPEWYVNPFVRNKHSPRSTTTH